MSASQSTGQKRPLPFFPAYYRTPNVFPLSLTLRPSRYEGYWRCWRRERNGKYSSSALLVRNSILGRILCTSAHLPIFFFFSWQHCTSACSVTVLAFSSLCNLYFPESLELPVYLKLRFDIAQTPETNVEELLGYSTLLLQNHPS